MTMDRCALNGCFAPAQREKWLNAVAHRRSVRAYADAPDVEQMSALHYAAARHAQAQMRDGATWAAAVRDGAMVVPADILGPGPVKLSVFALSDACRGVSIHGAKYALEDGTLSNAFPLGVSNEFAAPEAVIEVREGALLVIACKED